MKKRFWSEEVEKAYAKAFKERLYLRCLSKGHKQAQCRDPMLCFKCKGVGHNFGRCTKGKDPPTNKEPPKRGPATPVQQNRTYAQIVVDQKAVKNK